MKEIANDYLMDKWKGLSPSRISHRFLPHASRSWPHAASRRTLDLGFIVRVSHPVMGGTPLKGKNLKQISQNSSLLLLKTVKSLNRLTTYLVPSYIRCGTKIKYKSKTNTKLLNKRKYEKRSWFDVPIRIELYKHIINR